MRKELSESLEKKPQMNWKQGLNVIRNRYKHNTKNILSNEDAHMSIPISSIYEIKEKRSTKNKKKQNKTNRGLKKDIQIMTEEAYEYANKLANEIWLRLR